MEIQSPDWITLKGFVDIRLVPMQYIEFPSYYYISAIDGPFHLFYRLDRDPTDTTDLLDFENNYKPASNTTYTDTTGIPLSTPRPFASAGKFRARLKGIEGTAIKSTSSNIDYLLTEERFINGVMLLVDNHVLGDSVDFQVVDTNGTGVSLGWYTQAVWDAMPGGEYVADTFGDTWWVDPQTCAQRSVVIPYPAQIVAGLTIRVVYNSVGTVNDVPVRCNLYLHKKGI